MHQYSATFMDCQSGHGMWEIPIGGSSSVFLIKHHGLATVQIIY